jgi:hypothetical protein
MLTKVERVLILKGADLLREVGPRRLLKLAEVAREVELSKDGIIYREEDAAEGRVRLSAGERVIAEVGPGEAFGTWALVDDAERGQKAECIEDGLALAVHRDEFYDVAAGDLTLLQEVVRALARRLRTLVTERPEEARVEGEGVEKPEAMVETETFESDAAANAAPPSQGTALSDAVLGKTDPEEAPPSPKT